MKRYGLRFADARVPTVVVTEPVQREFGQVEHQPVRKVRGLTNAHAYGRALRWAREHGDPR